MNTSDDHRSERQSEKAGAVEAIEGALTEIENHGRGPDVWERVFLIQAIGALFRGAYRLAAVDADLAMTPPNERSRRPNLQPDALVDRCDSSLLRAAFREAVAEPIRNFPALGPVVFASRT